MSPYYSDPPLAAPHPFPAVTTTSAADACGQVLDFAGAWPRDAMNSRTVAEVRAGTGRLGKQDDPLLTRGGAAPADADSDGLPDDWERAHGMDPADPADSSQIDPSGYSRIELYVNELAQGLIGR